MHLAVIAVASAIHRVDVRTSPHLSQLLIGIDASHQFLQYWIVSRRQRENDRFLANRLCVHQLTPSRSQAHALATDNIVAEEWFAVKDSGLAF
jgi:hypothetical protein